MWKEEPLNQLTLLGEHSGSLTFAFSCSFPIISRDHTSLRSELLPSQINKTLCKILHNAFLMESVEIKSILNVCELLDRRIKKWREYSQYLVVR